MYFGREPPAPSVRVRLAVVDAGVDCPWLHRRVSIERCLECGRLLGIERDGEIAIECGLAADRLG